VKIRAATVEDLDQVCLLADESAELHHEHEPEVFAPPDTLRDRAFWLASIEQADGTVLVAVKQERVAGFITARILTTFTATFLRQRIICRVGSIVVSRQHRREGIGTSLIHAIEAWAVTRAALEVRLEVFSFNEEAIKFYATLGYANQVLTVCRSLP
jgi:ribosomal protein S18 acetylase RimI-like enzyme